MERTVIDNVCSRFDDTVEHDANIRVGLAAEGRLDIPAK